MYYCNSDTKLVEITNQYLIEFKIHYMRTPSIELIPGTGGVAKEGIQGKTKYHCSAKKCSHIMTPMPF